MKVGYGGCLVVRVVDFGRPLARTVSTEENFTGKVELSSGGCEICCFMFERSTSVARARCEPYRLTVCT